MFCVVKDRERDERDRRRREKRHVSVNEESINRRAKVCHEHDANSKFPPPPLFMLNDLGRALYSLCIDSLNHHCRVCSCCVLISKVF